MSKGLYPGELNLTQRHPLPRRSMACSEVPDRFAQLFGKLWLLYRPSLRWYEGDKDTECWCYNNPSPGIPPRMNNYQERANGEKGQRMVRRIMADIFFFLEKKEKERGKTVYVIMSCGNVDCVNPWHMLFSDHPLLRRDDE